MDHGCVEISIIVSVEHGLWGIDPHTETDTHTQRDIYTYTHTHTHTQTDRPAPCPVFVVAEHNW